MEKLRVFLADDHVLMREGLKLLLRTQDDMEVVGEAGDGETACRQACALLPDVVIMDVTMPGGGGVLATEQLKTRCPAVRVLVLSAHEDETHFRLMLRAGASGYVLKRSVPEELAHAVRRVAAGGVYLDAAVAAKVVEALVQAEREAAPGGSLSRREEQVMRALAWGHTNREIGELLHLSVKTVETHKSRLLNKLRLRTRADIVRYALRRGWLQEE